MFFFGPIFQSAMKPTETAQEIINTIGLISLFMIGASAYEYYENGVSFRIYGSIKFNHVLIEIDSINDEHFNFIFKKYCSRTEKELKSKRVEGVLFSDLRATITKETDLFTQI